MVAHINTRSSKAIGLYLTMINPSSLYVQACLNEMTEHVWQRGGARVRGIYLDRYTPDASTIELPGFRSLLRDCRNENLDEVIIYSAIDFSGTTADAKKALSMINTSVYFFRQKSYDIGTCNCIDIWTPSHVIPKEHITIIIKKVQELCCDEMPDDENVDATIEEIQDHGFQVPVVIDCGGTVIAGQNRYIAARRLKLIEIPCILASQLTPDQIEAYDSMQLQSSYTLTFKINH